MKPHYFLLPQETMSEIARVCPKLFDLHSDVPEKGIWAKRRDRVRAEVGSNKQVRKKRIVQLVIFATLMNPIKGCKSHLALGFLFGTCLKSCARQTTVGQILRAYCEFVANVTVTVLSRCISPMHDLCSEQSLGDVWHVYRRCTLQQEGLRRHLLHLLELGAALILRC